jgi:hypothetical protein
VILSKEDAAHSDSKLLFIARESEACLYPVLSPLSHTYSFTNSKNEIANLPSTRHCHSIYCHRHPASHV